MHPNKHPVVRSHRKWLAVKALVLASTTFAPSAFAFGSFEHLTPVSHQILDQQRGGFMVNGMEIRFGIEMQTYINGIRQATTRIHDLPNSNLIQVGSGNALSAGAFKQAAGLTTVIQNSLDAQIIQHLTILNMQIHQTAAYKGLMHTSPMLQYNYPAS